MDKSIICKNISKSFDNNIVLKDINLTINKGEFVVIGGENASGKSTLMKILIGLLIPNKGSVNVLGLDTIKYWKKISTRIGVVLNNERTLYWKLTAEENLDVFGKIYGVKNKVLKERIKYLLKQVGLENQDKKLVENYSTGMKRKLMLCKALIHDPEIIFADEILNGLDPQACLEIMTILHELNKRGKTIVLISHILHTLPDDSRIVLMKKGSIILDKPLKSLDVEKMINIKYSLNGVKYEKKVSEKDFKESILKIIDLQAEDIKIENENIYDTTRRKLS